MPLFDYKCQHCGHITEVLQQPRATAKPKCPKCGSTQMKKLLSAFGVGKGGSSAASSCPTGTCPLS